ncbi:MAG TPA: GNAT family N-acetyltransferase [Allosphingosinicella sp.]|nr:GNAT family N-acetyltransferase [Allosphingosinicella sp.]
MKDADEALREMAANRGCRLVKSRVRTPGRGDYGKFGLKDAKTGKAVLGFGKKGLTATAEEIEAFLRGGAASAWQSSVGKRPPRPKAKAKPAAAPKARAEPKLVLRNARPKDVEALAALIVTLGYEVTPAELRTRLAALKKAGHEALVADRGGVIGLLTTWATTVLHRPRPVGRISLMVVAEQARGQGIGAALVAEAEARLKAAGCGLVEVTSNVKRLRAHAFYERLGYERTSHRFAKHLRE